MSDKNFMSYEDAEEVLTEYAGAIKRNRFKNKTYEQWLAMTEEERETGKYLVSGVPNADGNVAIEGMVKLWENPDPTVAFVAQQISISDAANYDLLYCVSKWNLSNYKQYNAIAIMRPTETTIMNIFAGGSNGIVASYRTFGYVDATTYSFGTGWRMVGGNTAEVSDNEYCIPLYVYGIKLNHTLTIDAIARDVSTSADKCMVNETTSVKDVLDRLGTAANKDSTNAVTQGSTALVESGAVYSYVDTMITQAINAGY